MTLVELQSTFAEGMSNTIYAPVPEVLVHDKHLQNRYQIYSLAAMNDLVTELKKMSEDPWDHQEDKVSRFSVRFLIDLQGKLWLAREGKPGTGIPAHSQMRDRCLAAGSLTFSDDYEKIIAVSNESGHFQPKSSSLAWVLGVLIYASGSVALHEDSIQLKLISIEPRAKDPTKNVVITATLDQLKDIMPERELYNELVPGILEKNLVSCIEKRKGNDLEDQSKSNKRVMALPSLCLFSSPEKDKKRSRLDSEDSLPESSLFIPINPNPSFSLFGDESSSEFHP